MPLKCPLYLTLPCLLAARLCRFDIYTVSKPATPIAALAYPLLRFYQRRFVHDSMAALKREMAPAPQAAGKVLAAAGKQRA